MICSLMKSAYNLGLIGINPAERERITLPKLEEEQTEIFTEQELDDLLQALEDEPLMFRLLIHMALNTGCRRGELMGLNKPMYPTTPTQWFSKFQKRNDLPHRKFHALRHTSATLLLSNGTNIKNVATRLGHTQLKTTNRYVHAVEQAERQAAKPWYCSILTMLIPTDLMILRPPTAVPKLMVRLTRTTIHKGKPDISAVP